MKVICTQENLAKVVTFLERVSGKQTSLPILSNILLETEKGRLRLSATNLEIGVIVTLGAKIEREGRITIPAKLLVNFVHNLPSGEVVELEAKNNTLSVRSGAYEGLMNGTDGKDFPIIPEFKKEKYPIEMEAQEIKAALQKLLFCVSQNESRQELTGINVEKSGEGFRFAATDSFRLAEWATDAVEKDAGETFIVPSETFQEVLRVLQPETKTIGVAVEENQIFFQVDSVQIISRLIHGKFPDYQQIIPVQFQHVVVFDRETLLRSVRIASILSSYNVGEITLSLNLDEGRCVVSSVSQDIGKNESSMSVDVEKGSGTMEFYFQSRYLIEGITALTDENIVFQANTTSTPVLLQGKSGKGSEKYRYVLMPIRRS